MTILRRLGSAMLILGVLAFMAGPQSAEAAGYIKFEGIDGESKDTDHKKWIDIISVQFGDGQTGARMPSGSSAEPMVGSNKELIITKRPDRSSPKLHKACSSGEHFKEAKLHMLSSSGEKSDRKKGEYFVYEMKDVMVTSCSRSRGAAGEPPMETFSLNYGEIKTGYTEADQKGKKKGNVETEWKVEEGER